MHITKWYYLQIYTCNEDQRNHRRILIDMLHTLVNITGLFSVQVLNMFNQPFRGTELTRVQYLPSTQWNLSPCIVELWLGTSDWDGDAKKVTMIHFTFLLLFSLNNAEWISCQYFFIRIFLTSKGAWRRWERKSSCIFLIHVVAMFPEPKIVCIRLTVVLVVGDVGRLRRISSPAR